MRKKFFIGMAFVALAAGFFSIRMANQPSDPVLTPLQMQNLEALTQSETGSAKKKTCFNTITSKDGCKVCYCPICDYIDGTDTTFASKDECTK